MLSQVLGGVAKGVRGLVQTGQFTVQRNSNVGPEVRRSRYASRHSCHFCRHADIDGAC